MLLSKYPIHNIISKYFKCRDKEHNGLYKIADMLFFIEWSQFRTVCGEALYAMK